MKLVEFLFENDETDLCSLAKSHCNARDSKEKSEIEEKILNMTWPRPRGARMPQMETHGAAPPKISYDKYGPILQQLLRKRKLNPESSHDLDPKINAIFKLLATGGEFKPEPPMIQKPFYMDRDEQKKSDLNWKERNRTKDWTKKLDKSF